jgi:hypothetical protein
MKILGNSGIHCEQGKAIICDLRHGSVKRSIDI